MTIKSLLIGSAAAVVAASSAQAADAIVAADPEPVEYVQVCQDFGTGYFYIPGTETCLKIGGYVRIEASSTDVAEGKTLFGHDSRLTLDAKSSTEVGTLAAHFRLDENTIDSLDVSTKTGKIDFDDEKTVLLRNHQRILGVDRAHISIGDVNVFNIGLNGSIWDSSIVGDQFWNPNGSSDNQIQYSVALDAATIWVQFMAGSEKDVAARLDFTAADLDVKLFYGYDGKDTVTGARSGAKIELSYMGFGAYYSWSEGANGTFNAGTATTSFGSGAKNVFGVGYGFDATDKLNIALAADFADGIANVNARDAYGLSANFAYTIVEGLVADARIARIDYIDAGGADSTSFRLRLTRSF